MKKILVLVLALILSLGCMSAMAEEIDWRALEGGELMVYVGCDEEHGAAVVKAFEEKTGIKTSYIRLSGNDCYTRILEERENPQADVWEQIRDLAVSATAETPASSRARDRITARNLRMGNSSFCIFTAYYYT